MFDRDFCFTFLYPVASVFRGSVDCICGDICLFSGSWKSDSGTSDVQETEGGRKLYDWRERGRRVSFPHVRRKTKLRPGFLVIRP